MNIDLPLTEVPTRVLMNCRRHSDYENRDGTSTGPTFIWSRPAGVDANGDTFYAVCRATRDQVMAELNTRPHITSRKEGKKLRQLMSKTGMSEKELRAHSKYGMELGDAAGRRCRIKAQDAREYAASTGRPLSSLFYGDVVFT